MINQLQQPVNPMAGGGQQPVLIEQQHMDGMTEEEFEQMQAAIVASMNEEEEIHIGEDDEDEGQEANQGMI